MKTAQRQLDFGSVTPDLGNTVLLWVSFWGLTVQAGGREKKIQLLGLFFPPRISKSQLTTKPFQQGANIGNMSKPTPA